MLFWPHRVEQAAQFKRAVAVFRDVAGVEDVLVPGGGGGGGGGREGALWPLPPGTKAGRGRCVGAVILGAVQYCGTQGT